MANLLALPLLFDAVRAQFTADGSNASIVFGKKEVAKQMNQGPGGANRVVFAPGDLSDKFANDLPPRNPGREIRPLATEEEFFVCWIWAADSSDLTDERKQYTAARALYDQWRRAIYLATHTDGDVGIGPVTILAQEWNRKRLERAFGAEIIAVCSVHAMVPDADGYEVVDPPLNSNTTVTELGQVAVVHT